MDKNFLILFLSEMELNNMFSDTDLTVLATKFKVLSESSRLKILRTLFDGEKCVSEIIDQTGLQQANVSKQLKILASSGIVECRPQGLMRYYKLADFTVLKICNAICRLSEN